MRRAAVLLGVALVAGCTGGRDSDALPAPFESPSTAAHHEVSAGVGARPEKATLDVVSGVTSVVVRGGGTGLVRASTPADSQVAPVVSVDGDVVRVRLVAAGGPGPAALTVVLGPDTRWDVRISGGAQDATLELGGVRLGALDFPAGISRIDATLPRPAGVVPVRMSGGASDLRLHLPAGAAYGLRVDGGAGSVETDGVRRTGLAGGTEVTASTAADRYQVDAVAGVSSVVVDRQ
jgi:hypothetical protein